MRIIAFVTDQQEVSKIATSLGVPHSTAPPPLPRALQPELCDEIPPDDFIEAVSLPVLHPQLAVDAKNHPFPDHGRSLDAHSSSKISLYSASLLNQELSPARKLPILQPRYTKFLGRQPTSLIPLKMIDFASLTVCHKLRFKH
jgi:hypothetical protein